MIRSTLLALALIGVPALSIAQSGFQSGSNGSYGPIYVSGLRVFVNSPNPPSGPLTNGTAIEMGSSTSATGAVRFHAANPQGCTAGGGIPAGTFTAVALIRSGACSFSEKILNAQSAGATSVIIFNDSDALPNSVAAGTNAIPSFFVTRAYGEALRDFIIANGSTPTQVQILNQSIVTRLQVPPDGIFHATTIEVLPTGRLAFDCNARNTPVYLLAAGDVTIRGIVDVSAPQAGQNPFPSPGGCGGFAGGAGAIGQFPPGDGYGPGAGRASPDSGFAGNAGYGSAWTGALDGPTYGSNLLIPLVGGSGGGGRLSFQGGGGGGAILIASSTQITLPSGGTVVANGTQSSGGGGSSGAIRLVAFRVAGNGQLNASNGRIRVDTVDRTGFQIQRIAPANGFALGSLMQVFPPSTPELHIVNVAGTAVPVGSGPVNVLLPIGSPATQNITLRGIGFTGSVPVRVVLTPDSGSRIVVDGTLTMGGQNSAEVTLQAQVPANVTMNVSAWVRNQ